MPRSRAERAKQKVDPLIEQGRRVSLLYSNDRAFEKRQITRTYGTNKKFTYTHTRDRMPSPELLLWMDKNCGPRGILWTTKKVDDGIDVFFAVPGQAMMFKLTWGGQ